MILQTNKASEIHGTELLNYFLHIYWYRCILHFSIICTDFLTSFITMWKF